MDSNGEPSQTAMTAAAARAAHLIVDDEPLIFRDTLAYRLLGDLAETLVGYHRAKGTHPVLVGARAAVVTRSRYTEDLLEEGGFAQYVILGAGLDTFAYRSPLAGRVRVFEVDHPSSQRWKRGLLEAAGVPVPPSLAFVPVDLEAGSPLDALVAGGFDPAVPALVGWLGVTMYLTREAIGRTLDTVAGLAPGTEIVLDYMLPEGLRDAAGQAYVEAVAPVAAERGEPWLTFLSPEEMSSLLREHGLEVVRHSGQRDSVDPALWDRSDALRPSHLSVHARARVPGV
ncbi:SAM-dependent methyltransferase [Microbispora corallina]|uniref:S-adenosyl-L-methionine-dependent methyltransferase n=1 Tax=Microbispora corallina TaxID=83302 RepID=A0ABQ4FYD2_9ACTN|nr:class I SAM-dependent methyltransferase [Microbispora corallina]GIH39803.1 S-adenosyl-L-methionine-dependent methyltransferase [Microbispora corallina]